MTEKRPEDNYDSLNEIENSSDLNIDKSQKNGESVTQKEEEIMNPDADKNKGMEKRGGGSKIGNTAKSLIMAGMVTSSGADANEAPKNADLFPDAIETNYEAKEESTKDIADPFNALSTSTTELETTPTKKTTEKESAEDKENTTETSKENLEVFEKVVDAGFDMGKADIPKEKVEEIKNEFSLFLESLPDDIKEKINKGELEIMIKGSASPHSIAETGVDTGKRGKAFTNKQLAEFRADEGVHIMKMALEDSPSIMKAEIIASIPPNGVYEGDPNKAIEEGRFVKISIKDVIESNTIKVGLENPEILKNLPTGTVAKMYIDGSDSMKNKASKLFLTLEKGGYIDGSVILQFGGGAGEISDVKKVSSVRDVEIFDGSIQAREKFSNREETFKNAKELLKNMPMVKYEDRNENSKKIISLLTDEYLKITAKEISELEIQEEARDAKLIFFMENRDSGKVTTLTLEEIKELYESKAKNGEMLTLDVNEKKIEDKKPVDVVVK